MAKKDLESKTRKAVLNIEKEVIDINHVLGDLSMKLGHIIRYRKDLYGNKEGNSYYA